MGLSAVPGRSGVGSTSIDTIQYWVVVLVYKCLYILSKWVHNSVSGSKAVRMGVYYIRTYDKHLLVDYRGDLRSR